MENKNLKINLAAYSALGTTFLALAPHEAEAQITYVNLPDQKVCAVQSIPDSLSYTFKSDYRFIHLDLDGISLNVSSQVNGVGAFSPKPGADVLFIANAWVVDNDPLKFDNEANAYVYGYNNSLGGVSNFMGTGGTKGYIKPLNYGDTIGPGVARATNGWGVMPGILYATDGSGGVNKDTVGDPGFISGSPSNDLTTYVGVAFEINGNTHYGWVQLRIEQTVEVFPKGTPGVHAASSCVTIMDYAYENKADTPIQAGEGALAPGQIPTMSEWGLITLAFFLLSFGTVLIYRKEAILEIPGGRHNGHGSLKIRFGLMPLDVELYLKALKGIAIMGALVATCSLFISGNFTVVDLIGGSLAALVIAYWTHLLLLFEREEQM